MSYGTLIFNPEGDGNMKINLEQEGPEGAGFIQLADSYVFNAPADGVYNITVVTDNSVLTLYINDCLGYTTRLYGTARNCWSVNCYTGNLAVSEIKVQSK